jgi:hypothetical protein
MVAAKIRAVSQSRVLPLEVVQSASSRRTIASSLDWETTECEEAVNVVTLQSVFAVMAVSSDNRISHSRCRSLSNRRTASQVVGRVWGGRRRPSGPGS